MLNFAIPIAVSNVADCFETRLKTVRDIHGDLFARKKVCHILLDELGTREVLEFGIESIPASRLIGWGEDPVEDKPVRDAGGDLHLEVEELLNRGDHGLKVIRNRIVFLQVQDILNCDGGENQ